MFNPGFQGKSFLTAYAICVEADFTCQLKVLNTDTITDTETALMRNHDILFMSTCISPAVFSTAEQKHPFFYDIPSLLQN